MTSVCNELLSDSDEEELDDQKIDDKPGPLRGAAHNDDENESGSSEDSTNEEEEGVELDDIRKQDVETEPVQIGTATAKSFKELAIHSWLTNQLSSLQMTKPTPVQTHCIPKVLEGCDVLGCAKTGTGKTLAFALPILNNLAVDPYGIYALILTPTRELAFQIADQFMALGKPIALKTSVIVGGRSLIDQAAELIKRPHVVVATPGRLSDLIQTHADDIGKLFLKIQYFVLDEADRMLDGQYNEQLKTVFEAIPKKRQTLLFSATITSAITKLHKVSVKKPYFFEDKSDIATVEKLEQKYVVCPTAVKDAYLVYVVKNYCERNDKSSVIIFAQTCRECQALAYMFNGLGFNVGSLHSQISQKSRLSSLAAFRSKTLKVIICTDVASRGLDIPHVDLVVNHNVPQCPKTYVHRVGRSARAGRYGAALTFVTQYDVVLLQAVESLIGKKLDELKVNDKKVATYVTKVLVSKREAELKLEHQNFGERNQVNKRKELILSGMTEDEADKHLDDLKTRRVSNTKRKVEKLSEKLGKKQKRDDDRVRTKKKKMVEKA